MDVNKQWRKLGLALGLRPQTLDGIEATYPTNLEDCKEEMLTSRCCSPSWNELVEAIRNPTVQHSPIADKIKQKYLA